MSTRASIDMGKIEKVDTSRIVSFVESWSVCVGGKVYNTISTSEFSEMGGCLGGI